MKKLEILLNIVVLFVLSGAIISHLNDENGIAYNKDSTYSNLMLYISYVIILSLASKWILKILRLLRNNKIILSITVMVILSPLWSQSVDLSTRRCIPFVFGILYSGYLSLSFSNNQLVNLLYKFSIILTILNLLTIIILPNYGVAHDIDEGAWRGLFFHKNGLGRICAFNILFTFLFLKSNTQKLYTLPAFMIFLNFLLLIFSNSVTPLLSVFTVFTAFYYLKLFIQKGRPLPTSLKVVSILIITSLIIFSANYDISSFDFLGRDDSFSGRLPLWALIFSYIAQSPLLGYGYSAFWVPEILEKTVWLEATWGPQQGHNGFIDVTLELGIIGLLLVIFLIKNAIKKRIKEINILSSFYDYWPYLYLVFTITISMMETFLLRQNNLYWTILLTASFDVSKFKRFITYSSGETIPERRLEVSLKHLN